MAYSQQAQYGSGAPHRPNYGGQDHSYYSTDSRGNAQAYGDQDYGYNGGYEDPGQQQPYSNQYGAQDQYGYEQGGGWSQQRPPAQRRVNDEYRNGNGNGQQAYGNNHTDQRRQPKPVNPGSHGTADPRNRGAAPPKSRSPANGHHGHQNHHDHQPREHRQRQNPGNQFDKYQNVIPPRESYDYSEQYNNTQHGDWQNQQNYDQNYDHQNNAAYPNGRHAEHQQQQPPARYDGGHEQRRPSPQNAPHAPRSNPAETSRPNTAKIATKFDEPQKPLKPQSQPQKRILDELKSPETLAWDNPFPTFPATKPKPKAHGHEKKSSQNDSISSSRPQTANGQNGHHQHIQEEMEIPRSSHDGRRDHAPEGLTELQGGGHSFVNQERPSSSRSRFPVPKGGDDLGIPTSQGRHSEDNRLRPTISNEVPRGSVSERTYTAPEAVTNAIVNPHDEMPEVAPWQEPGAAAGYHGGEDKGFVHSPTLGTMPDYNNQPTSAPRARSDESRQYPPKSRFPPPQPAVQKNLPIPQSHVQQDSVGEVFDSYFDNSQPPEVKPYVKENPYEARAASLDEMPNFGATKASTHAYDHEVAMSSHPQSQPPRSALPTQPIPQRNYNFDQSQQPATAYGAADPFPRSRSQPNFNGHPSPPSRQDQGFDFGGSRPVDRRPATSASNQPGPRGQYPPGPPSNRPYPGPQPGVQRYPGAGAGPEPPRRNDQYRSDDGYRDPQDPRNPNRHRSPPLQNGYGDPRQQGDFRPPAGPQGGPQDRFRSPPPQNGAFRDPRQQQPGYRSPPVQQQQGPHPPPDGRARRPPGGGPGGPSPNARIGPTSPPPTKPLPNPDALPHHPAPVRPGLMEGSPVNSASSKPPPVRQYNNTNGSAPTNLGGPSQANEAGQSSKKQPKRGSDPVTYQELDRLRQKTQNSPEDQATRFLLAKKLVEASTVLVNERADPKTREKAKDDYTAQALKILKKLSSAQYPDAMFYVGDLYSRGALGLAPDVKEAFTLYQSAAKANHAGAAYRVAVCCEMGQDEGGGTRKDPVKAMQWYKRAAQLGDVPAMYKMGIIQLKGLLGQPRNPREALVWLKKAAERADAENPHALHELALLYEQGAEGVPKDERYSQDLFVRCANLGYKFSQYRLGCAYEYGLMACPVDPRQSIAWYSKAAVQEEHQSELALSGWYLTGSEGVLQQSDTEAYLWARKAAQAGLAKAEYAMGYFTEVGIGAPANLEDAKRWYWRAASQNFPKARERLEDLRKGGAAKQKTRVSRSHMKKQSDGECIVM